MPRNTALVVIREKDGYINILRAPLAVGPETPSPALRSAHLEVALSLEAVSRGITAKSRELWQSVGQREAAAAGGGAGGGAMQAPRWLAAQVAAAATAAAAASGGYGNGAAALHPALLHLQQQQRLPAGLLSAGPTANGTAAPTPAGTATAAGPGPGPVAYLASSGAANGTAPGAPSSAGAAAPSLATPPQPPSRQMQEVCTLGRELAKALIYDTTSLSARPSQSPGGGLPHSSMAPSSFLMPEPTPPMGGSFMLGDHTSVNYSHTSPHAHFSMAVTSGTTPPAPAAGVSVSGAGATGTVQTVQPIPSRSATPPPASGAPGSGLGLELGGPLSPTVPGQAQWWAARAGSMSRGPGGAWGPCGDDAPLNVAIAAAATSTAFGAWGGGGGGGLGFGVSPAFFGSVAGSEPGVYDHLRLTGHAGPVLCMVLDEPGARLYTASVDCTIKVSKRYNSVRDRG